MEKDVFLKRLDAFLIPHFTPPNVAGGHDWAHVCDVVALGPKIAAYLTFDLDEFAVLARLHNVDRSPSLLGGTSEEERMKQLLADSPFDNAARARIINAALRHSQKDIQPDDSNLLIALMDADKLVRFQPSWLLGVGAFGFTLHLPLFLPTRPFGFMSTKPKDRFSIWIEFMSVLEWVGMLSCDAARAMIDKRYLRLRIEFLRLWGEEIAAQTGVENTSEDDIKKSLGRYYGWTLEHAGL
ncbi:MAG: hypothetical protein Q7S84_01350 [bacterium]|nr:hypothetical protein [bacterium]